MLINLQRKRLHLDILDCIKNNNLEGLQSLINQNGVNIDKLGSGYNKPLIYAFQNIPKSFDNINNQQNYTGVRSNTIRNGYIKQVENEGILMEWREKREIILRYLIDISENLNFEIGPDGETPLFLALKFHYFSIAEYLLQDEEDKRLERKKYHKLNTDRSFIHSSSDGHNQRLVDINYKNQYGQNVLLYLFQQKAMTPFALKLSMKKGIHINTVDTQGKSLLIHIVEGYPNADYYNQANHRCQMQKYLQMILQYYIFPPSTVLKLLIFYKSKIPISIIQLQEMIAREYQQLQVDIKDHEDPSPLRDGSNTALLKAVKRYDVETIQLLLQCHPNLEMKDNFGRTALMFFFMDGYKSLAQKLLEAGADVNAMDNDHHTPLFMACERHQVGATELFLKYGADPNTFINLTISNTQIPQTAMQIAVERGYWKIVDLLLKYNVDPNKPVYTAISSKTNNSGSDKKSDKEELSKETTTLLILACQKGHKRVVQSLLEHGANPDITDNHHKTGLQYARENNHLEILEIF